MNVAPIYRRRKITMHVKAISHWIENRCRDWRFRCGKTAKSSFICEAFDNTKHTHTHTHKHVARILVIAVERDNNDDRAEWHRHKGKSDTYQGSWKAKRKCLITLCRHSCWSFFTVHHVTPWLASIYIGSVSINQRTVSTGNWKKFWNEKWNSRHFYFLHSFRFIHSTFPQFSFCSRKFHLKN